MRLDFFRQLELLDKYYVTCTLPLVIKYSIRDLIFDVNYC